MRVTRTCARNTIRTVSIVSTVSPRTFSTMHFPPTSNDSVSSVFYGPVIPFFTRSHRAAYNVYRSVLGGDTVPGGNPGRPRYRGYRPRAVFIIRSECFSRVVRVPRPCLGDLWFRRRRLDR